jgi:multidrug efflux pump subunit AcrA (membrane-fusion protein)
MGGDFMRGFNKKFLLLISILFTLGILAGCEANSKVKSLTVPTLTAPQEVQGKLHKVSKGSISNLLIGDGTVVSGKTQKLVFNSSGVIKSINIKPDVVAKKGDILAQLDTDKLMNDIKIQSLELEKTQLFYEEMVTQKADDISLQLASLDVKQQKMQLDILKENSNKCVIIAPFDGKVTYCYPIEVGQGVGNEPIFSIESTAAMMVKCSDENAKKYRVGMKAELRCSSNIYNAEVVSIGNINREDGTKYSVLRLAETPDAKYYGASGRVLIEISKRENVVVIPRSYIKTTNNFTYVNVVKNNIKEQRFVMKGLETDDSVEIVNALKEGEEIVDN